MVSGSSLVEEALRGSNPGLTRLAARGLLPLAPEELVPLQVELTQHADAEVAGLANEALASLEPRVLVPFLAHDAAEEVLRYFARLSDDRGILEAILRRRSTPLDLLIELGVRLPADLQEILLLRQDAIVEQPEILEALERNPDLTPFSRRRIREYREHLLPGAAGFERARPAGLAKAQVAAFWDDEVAEAVEAVRSAEEEVVAEGQFDEVTGLSEGQVRLLPVQVRLALARGAPLSLRRILIGDSNTQVALAVLRHNPLNEQELELIARNRAVASEVLEELSKRREWIRHYRVMQALVTNPRTPVAVAMRFINSLTMRDLRDLSNNRNVADPLRQAARRRYRIKLT